jgi:hypothetical protein
MLQACFNGRTKRFQLKYRIQDLTSRRTKKYCGCLNEASVRRQLRLAKIESLPQLAQERLQFSGRLARFDPGGVEIPMPNLHLEIFISIALNRKRQHWRSQTKASRGERAVTACVSPLTTNPGAAPQGARRDRRLACQK